MIYTVTLNPSLDRTLHYPGLALGQVNRATSSQLDLSGKGVNISIALRHLGQESILMGLAAGIFGQALVEGLSARGYHCDFVQTAGETRSNVTVIDDAQGITTKLNEAGPEVDEATLAALEARLLEQISPGDIVAFAGSLPPGAPDDTYARLIEGIHGVGALAALDTSGPPLAKGCRAQPDLVKPNAYEAEELLGKPIDQSDLAETLSGLRALGPRRVLLSLGAKGAVYTDGTECWRAVPPPITEVNAVGAGDAALAGALYALAEGCGPENIARWAVATGTAATRLDGTRFPARHDVEAMFQRVAVKVMTVTDDLS